MMDKGICIWTLFCTFPAHG